MRLIDANALKVSYCKQCLKETGNEQIEVKQTPYCAVACQDFDVIDKQPTVDAVQVVRCGECKHWDKWACDKDGGHECLYNGGVWMKDEFCSDGERKDGEKGDK